MSDRGAVRVEPWGEGDPPLLEKLMGNPEMTEHLGGPESREKIAERQARYERLADSGRKLGFTLVEECELEYPPGRFMQCNDWRLDLFVNSSGRRRRVGA